MAGENLLKVFKVLGVLGVVVVVVVVAVVRGRVAGGAGGAGGAVLVVVGGAPFAAILGVGERISLAEYQSLPQGMFGGKGAKPLPQHKVNSFWPLNQRELSVVEGSLSARGP